MQKKGDVTLLGVFVGIVIGAIILAVVASVGTGIWKLLPWAGEQDENYFSELETFFNSKAVEKEMVYYVSKEHFLAGFGKSDGEIKSAKRPVLQCGNMGEAVCICNCDLSGGITSNACLEAECFKLKDIEEIKGITLLDDDIKDAREGSLLIKGRNKIVLRIKKQDSTAIFSLMK